MKCLIVLLTFFIGGNLSAAELRARTLWGDRDVRFRATNAKGKPKLEILVMGRKPQSISLKPKEWNYLVSEFQKLPVANKIPAECRRARMDVVYKEGGKAKNKVKMSCFGNIQTITSPRYNRFARILALKYDYGR